MAYPKFQFNSSRYDQTTFSGRFLHCLDLIDPRTLFTTKEELKKSVQLLEDHKNNLTSPNITDEQLWKAQKIKQAILHPDTGEKIFMPFRMSGFVPFGSPIVLGLLLPNQSIPSMIFWQWLNQSHNACVNYANRNATKPTSTSTLLQGYIGATSAAVSISVGLKILTQRLQSVNSNARLVMLQRFIPYPAVATASVLNVILMRKHEAAQGIDVLDKSGKIVGTSRKAAKKALIEMAVSRAVIPAPILLIPPIVITQLEKMQWFRSRPKLNIPITAVVVTLSFAFGLPLGISIFPQVSKIKRQNLELEIQTLTNEDVLYYNKGL